MTKLFKKLCLILAILILPMAFVGCGKDPETPATTPGGGGSSNPPETPVVFELNEAAANEIIGETITVFEDAIDVLNASNIFEIDNDDAN